MGTRTRWLPTLASALVVLGLAAALGARPTLAQRGPVPDTKVEQKQGPSPEPLPLGPAVTTAPGEPQLLPTPAEIPTSPGVVGQPAAPADDDPEKAADEFVNRTRGEADAAVQRLTAEAESLRARLQKVESALRRWKAIQTALGQKPADGRPEETPLDEPPLLKPAPPPQEPIKEDAPAEKKASARGRKKAGQSAATVARLLEESEQLRMTGDDWERFWLLDQTSHLTPFRSHGGLGP